MDVARPERVTLKRNATFRPAARSRIAPMSSLMTPGLRVQSLFLRATPRISQTLSSVSTANRDRWSIADLEDGYLLRVSRRGFTSMENNNFLLEPFYEKICRSSPLFFFYDSIFDIFFFSFWENFPQSFMHIKDEFLNVRN